MSSYGQLRVGDVLVSSLRNGVSQELLAVFRDEMLHRRLVTADEYYGSAQSEEDMSEGPEHIELTEFRAPGREITQRLDVLGISESAVSEWLDEVLSAPPTFDDKQVASFEIWMQEYLQKQQAFRQTLTPSGWWEALRGAPDGSRTELGTRQWLLGEVDYSDDRYVLRACLLAFPDADVVLDVTDLEESGWLANEPESLASTALESMRLFASAHAPLVVLTEGRTDAEFLGAALHLLFPHLTDLVRFLDYDQKAEGGVGHLTRMVRAFAAAGIANKVVAVFDNDAAAVDALRGLDLTALPDNIRVVRYPDTDLCASYPTLGPPTVSAPSGVLMASNVNGHAGSIELYLGQDVLTGVDGSLHPVQWGAYLSGIRRYQGTVTGKTEIHERFRKKVERANSGAPLVHWGDLETILRHITNAFVTD